MDLAHWIAFVTTVTFLQMPPGPDSMLVMARGSELRYSPCSE
jgi:threonine/homoserine/homoserine lactone efflux protein